MMVGKMTGTKNKQIVKHFKDHSYQHFEAIEIMVVEAEDKFESFTNDIQEEGYKLVSHSISGKRGFFINDFVITAIYEKE